MRKAQKEQLHTPLTSMMFDTISEECEGQAAGHGDAGITLLIASERSRLLGSLIRRLADEPDFKLVGDPIRDPSDLLAHLEARLPRLLLLDKRFLDRLGAEATRLRKEFPALNVLLLCESARLELIDPIVAYHFHGFVLVHELDNSVKAIRRVIRGELWLPRWLLAKAIYRLFDDEHDQFAAAQHGSESGHLTIHEPDGHLTEREAQVVGELRQGLSNKEIAQKLGVQEDTVKKHLRNVFAKLGVRRRSQLMLPRETRQTNMIA
jgi:DNA-binding NarL/FixJ family response regulator